MLPVIPWYIDVIDVVACIGLAIAVWVIFSTSASRAFRLGSALFLGAWLVGALATAPSPASLLVKSQFPITPTIPFFGAVPALIVILAFVVSPTVRRALSSASLPAIHAVQVFRLIGAEALILLAQGQLPAHFAVPAGWGDLFIGATALPVASMLARGVPGSRAIAVVWNVLGLIDLVVAAGMGTGFLVHQPPAPALGIFPMILLPTFGVPLAMILHVINLSRLPAASQASASSNRSTSPISL